MSARWLMVALLATAPVTARVTPGPVHLPPPPLQSFDGRWVLDTARSEFGSAASGFRAREDEIVTDGERVRVRSRAVRASGDSTSLDYVYRADGEAENTLRGQLVRTSGRHVGKTLEFVSVAKLLLLELRSEERWSLAAGGDTLLMERTARSPLGVQHQLLYFGHERPAGAPAKRP